ncbi:MAG: hypothetical protein ACK4TA_17635 [Saprospiraceae bacterium]
MHRLLSYIRTSPVLRSTLVVFFLGCVSVGVFGEWLVFQIVRADMRRSMQATIAAAEMPTNDLVLIKIADAATPKDFIWVEAGREFRYQGQMYDIVRQEKVNDSTFYYCVHDIRESQLYANVEKQLEDEFSASTQHQTKHRELIKRIPDFYLLSTNSITFNFNTHTPKPQHKLLFFLDTLLFIDAPPPEIA